MIKNLILKNNNNKIPNDKEKYIYIIKSPDFNLINPSINNILKIDKTIKYKNRMRVHNSSNKNNVLILYNFNKYINLTKSKKISEDKYYLNMNMELKFYLIQLKK